MAEQDVNGTRLYYEERDEGAPIVRIHGAGGAALARADALDKLRRVIADDRRGCEPSERPEPYERTSVAELDRHTARRVIAST